MSQEESISNFDHRHRFLAIERSQQEVAARFDSLLENNEPQDVIIEDPESRLFANEDVIRSLWSLFPRPARERAVPTTPVISVHTPRWFTPASTEHGPVATENAEEALSPTAQGLGYAEPGERANIFEIAENGFSQEVRGLVQRAVIVHELGHMIVNMEACALASERQLLLPNGETVRAYDLIWDLIQTTERNTPISWYSAAYRTPEGDFPRTEEGHISVKATNEEIVEHVTAYLLGFIVGSDGNLTFNPFVGREDAKGLIEQYLNAEWIDANQ